MSDRFELARNFTNKLWNASRFALINLEGCLPQIPDATQLRLEDRWILSRLATVSRQVTDHLGAYKYAEAARTLYDFAWDDFCSFYIEMLKDRFQNPETRGIAQSVLAHTLDTLLRLLHPFIPFITEEIWGLLGRVCPQRGILSLVLHEPVLARASWPTISDREADAGIEGQFATFQATLAAVREIRSRQNLPPKQAIEFSVRCEPAIAKQLQPMQPYFASMAKATCVRLGRDIAASPTDASMSLGFADIFVDLKGLIDVKAEIDRNEKQRSKLVDMISGKERKLSQETFVSKAPPDIVRREQEQLSSLKEQLVTVEAALTELRKP